MSMSVSREYDSAGPAGWATSSPLALALILVLGLYWIVRTFRPTDPSRPPYAPYWVPWLGSAIELGKDPDGFFSNTTKRLGPVFRLKTLGQEMVYVTSPSLISAVYRDSQNYNFPTIRTEMGEKIFSMRKSVAYSRYVLDTYMVDFHNVLLPSNLKPMISLYLESVHDALCSMIPSMDGASGPLETFIFPAIYRAAAHAGMGPTFPAERSFPLLKTYNDSFHLVGAGLPRFLLSKPWKAWDDLIDLLEAYASELDKSGDEMTPYAQIAFDGRRHSDWTYRDVALALAAQLWALQANSTYAAYWLFALVLQQPEGLSPLVAELDEARRQWEAANPSTPIGPAFFEQITANATTLPLLSSAIQEVLRYTSSTFSLRRVITPVKLGGYQLLSGDKVVCVTRATHLDDEIHPRAKEFDIRRYLETPRPTKDGKPVPNHTMPFGGGSSMCDGRHFAMTELRLFVAIFLTYASIEIDEGCSTRPSLNMEHVGTGILHPRGDMEVIMRKRRL